MLGWIALGIVVAGLLLVLIPRGDRVDPGAAVPRGENAPHDGDPDVAALREGLQRAKKQ